MDQPQLPSEQPDKSDRSSQQQRVDTAEQSMQEMFGLLERFTRAELLCKPINFHFEILATAEELQLMQLMNNLSREKYSQLSTSAQRFLTQMASTVAQCAPINSRLLFKDDKLDACVDQINEMDERVVYLEQIARELQEFTSELGSIFLLAISHFLPKLT